MTYVVTLFFILFAINIILAWSLIWARRDTWLRHMAVPYVLATLPVFAFVAIETLGRHKPSEVAWRELYNRKAEVLAYKLVPESAIYVYLDIGEAEPRAISLPWSAETARKLAQAMSEDGNGATVQGDQNWMMGTFVEHAPPPEPLPPKEELQPAEEFRQ